VAANEANGAINHLWSIFRSAGIADDLAIIEYTARLLLDESGLEIQLPDRLLPRHPPHRDEFGREFELLKHVLNSAAEQLGGDNPVQQFATLFDQHVLFHLSEMLAGGRYPTPRHIARFMQTLAEVAPDDTLADFTCGSGGLLITRAVTKQDRAPRTFGVEISPEWARIARANLLLHKISIREASIRDGNALNVIEKPVSPEEPDSRFFPFRSNSNKADDVRAFNRILMNPPFGEKVDAALTGEKLGKRISKSETALITLALRNLAQNGVAGVLAPSGLLFSNSSADKALRTELVNENTLNAVIALPKDAFQPYSPLQTNLLLFTKQQSPENHLTWFFQLEQDGYPSGRGRNLTQYPPPQTSDLPFVEQLWAKHHSNPDAQFPDRDAPAVGVYWFSSEAGYPGIVCWGITHALKSVDFIDPSTTESANQETVVEAAGHVPHLSVELITPLTEPKITVKIPVPETIWTSPRSTSAPVEASDEELEPEVEEAEEILEQVEPSAIKLLTSRAWAAAIAFFRKGNGTIGESPRLLGVAVQANDIQQQAYDLRPERYVIVPTESQSLKSPSELLADIYKNQRQLAKRIDNLFGHLELPAIATQKLPSPIFNDAELPLVAKFNREQREMWHKVRQKTETVIEEGADNYETAALFAPADIGIDDSESMAEAIRTLDLMERMGLIVPVTITEPQSDELEVHLGKYCS